MSEERVKPPDCRTMKEVRFGVDRIDEKIVALLAERFRYMDAAARIKPSRDQVRDEWRKADVIAKVRAAAAAESVPTEAATELYERLVEASIAYELDQYDRTRPPGDC
jgi:isochorismate pyruvate lyase